MYKVENHKYKVISCTIKIGKICIYIILKCAKYNAKHQAIEFKYRLG